MKGVFQTLALATACLSAALLSPMSAQAASEPTIIVVTHGQASDPFWSIVKNGVTQAGKDYQVKVDYRAPETFDMVAMGQLIEAAVNQHPAGLVVSDPDPEALGPAIRKAIAAGIPVISINSGLNAAASLGIKLHVGQEELTAGRAVGEALKQQGARNAICVNQEVGNVALDQRCEGVSAGFGSAVKVLPTTTDPAEVEAKIRATLSADPSIDAVVGLSAPLVGEPAVAAVQALGLNGKVRVASFDLSANFLKDIVAGKAEFAVDQQPFLQGYLPVSFLALNARYGTLPAGNVPSGPSLVTKANAAQVIELSAKGIR
ncbi:sugar ABC transporter substrate-binding protein [Pokkaliibacter sp. MBI-7]|uniref:sugar ABC transporter substrate-binding protein n=1 Tax=Pokkaliibacter sp. MBI-7 TaxID=3040600 RepID=UPI00244B50B9|nr:sugar ABC transporter substrate-binding protein [Pokkaliibacter sp. MBI-7]MDH2433061.1 sugar ABC transporter substrate-binding protein [Pokkaliibacter sp. MBI-7]